jgi:hypothetical protein
LQGFWNSPLDSVQLLIALRSYATPEYGPVCKNIFSYIYGKTGVTEVSSVVFNQACTRHQYAAYAGMFKHLIGPFSFKRIIIKISCTIYWDYTLYVSKWVTEMRSIYAVMAFYPSWIEISAAGRLSGFSYCREIFFTSNYQIMVAAELQRTRKL